MLHINLNSTIINPATPEPAPAVSVAYLLGASDAESGEYCTPEVYFLERTAVLLYVEGHESVAGETMLSKQTKVLYGVMA